MNQNRQTSRSPRLDRHLVVDKLHPCRLVHVVRETLLNELLIPHVAPCQRVVVQYIRNQSPVVAKDRDVPSNEGDFLLIEVWNHLLLSILSSSLVPLHDLAVYLPQSELRGLIDVPEGVTELS